MQIERKRAAETETCVPMEEDTKTANSTEQDDEVKQLLAKVSEEAEQRAYLARPGAEPKEPKPRDKGTDTRKILFQSVTSFGHKARTWLLTDQMDYDIKEVAERLRVEGYRSIWTPAKPTGRGGTIGENDGNDQTTLEILQVFGHPFFGS